MPSVGRGPLRRAGGVQPDPGRPDQLVVARREQPGDRRLEDGVREGPRAAGEQPVDAEAGPAGHRPQRGDGGRGPDGDERLVPRRPGVDEVRPRVADACDDPAAVRGAPADEVDGLPRDGDRGVLAAGADRHEQVDDADSGAGEDAAGQLPEVRRRPAAVDRRRHGDDDRDDADRPLGEAARR